MSNPWATIPGPGVRGIDLEVKSGCILGLVGPNGAGKTTLMQILAGILDLEDGQIQLDETSITTEQQHLNLCASVGYMPESVSWVGPGTPNHILSRLCAMRGIQTSEGEEILKLVGLSKRADDELSTLSKGMRQRLSLATALLGEPRILILDEPLNGLDPVAQGAFRTLLRQLAQRGTAIVISSHSLTDLERIIDEVVLMHRGRIVESGLLSTIERDLGIFARLDIAGMGSTPASFGDDIRAEPQHPHKGEDWAYRLHLEQGDWTAQMRASIQNELTITRMNPVSPDLEEVLSAATGLSVEDSGFDVFTDVEVEEDE